MAYHCKDFTLDLSFPTTLLEPTFAPFENQLQAVSFLQSMANRTGDFVPFANPTNTTLKACIKAWHCVPDNGASNVTESSDVVQLMTHGGGFDHRYYEFGGPDSANNQVKAATEAGFPVLLYDRLGAGESEKADPFKVVQMPVQADLLAELTRRLKDGSLGHGIPKPKKVVHIGHSIGSSITSGFVAKYPGLSDGVILTGWSTNNSFGLQFPLASGLRIAALQDPERWGKLSKGYWTWADEVSNQFLFFAYPYFTREALAEAERTKVPATIGEVATGFADLAGEYGGPMLIISGDRDQVLCGGDCYGILDAASELYTKPKPFKTYVQPNTGHGMTAHKSAAAGYAVINDFIKSSVGM